MRTAFLCFLFTLLGSAVYLGTKNRRLKNEIAAYHELIAISSEAASTHHSTQPTRLGLSQTANTERASTMEAAVQRGDHEAIALSLYAWGKADPDAALAWLADRRLAIEANSGFTFTKGYFLGAVLAGMAVDDPMRALTHVVDLRATGDSSGHSLFLRASHFYDRAELSNLVDALVDMPDAPLRLESLGVLVNALASTGRTDEAQALVEHSAQFENAENRAAVALNFILNAQLEDIGDGAGLANWLIDISPHDDLNQNVTSFIDRWASSDFNSTAQWLNEHSADAPWRDQAIAAFVRQAKEADATTAREWAEAIKEDTLRADALRSFDE